MGHTIPVTASEYLSVDNLPTGSIHMLIRRHDMPDKICTERYWEGMDRPEKSVYVPERKARKVRIPRKDHLRIGHLECSECGTAVGYNNRFCHHCGAEFEEE